MCNLKSRNFLLVTISAEPYFPPAPAGSLVETVVPLSTGSETISHLIGIWAAKRGPSQ